MVNDNRDDLDSFEGIIVDTREPKDKFLDYWCEFNNLKKKNEQVPEFRYHALPYGDYIIRTKNYQLLIERKEILDYCRSLGDNLELRFDHMRIENDLTMLLIEGEPDSINHRVISRWDGRKQEYRIAADYKLFKNFPLQQQMKGSIFIHTRDYKDTVFSIVNYWQYLDKLPEIEKWPIYKPWQRWFSLIPFVGKRRIKELFQKYSSCNDALVNLVEWADEAMIKGINENWQNPY